MKVNNKGYILPIFGIIILILVIAGGVYYLRTLRNKPQSQNPVVTSETPTPSLLPKPDSLADWKTYENEKYEYTLKYPATFTYKEEVLNPPDIFLMSTQFQDPTQTADLNNGFNIEVKDSSLEDAIEYYKWRVIGHLTDSFTSETSFTQDGFQGVNLIYKTGKDNPNTMIIISNGRYSYAIQGSTSLIEKILPALKISR